MKETEITTYSAKMPTETRDKIIQIIESYNLKAADFFEQVVLDYENKKIGHFSYKAQFDELNRHTRRINEIFNNLAKQNLSELEEKDRTHTSEIELLNQQIETITNRLDAMKEQLQTSKKENEELRGKKTKLLDTILAQRKENSKNELILSEYQEKITTKDELISSQAEEINKRKEAIEQNKQLTDEVEQLKQLVTQQEQMLVEVEQKRVDERQKLQREKVEELATLTKEKDFERKEALFLLREENQKHHSQLLQDHHIALQAAVQERINLINAHKKEIIDLKNEYEIKLKDLS